AVHGESGTYFHRLGKLSETLRLDPDLIDSIREAPGVQVALIVRSECITVVVGLANKLDCALQAQSRGIGDGQTQFPGVSLRKHGKSPQKHGKYQQLFHL